MMAYYVEDGKTYWVRPNGCSSYKPSRRNVHSTCQVSTDSPIITNLFNMVRNACTNTEGFNVTIRVFGTIRAPPFGNIRSLTHVDWLDLDGNLQVRVPRYRTLHACAHAASTRHLHKNINSSADHLVIDGSRTFLNFPIRNL